MIQQHLWRNSREARQHF